MNVVVQNLLTQYTDAGDPAAPVVLMLHGWGVDGKNFESLAKLLAADYRVICLDLPGFGGTQTPVSAWHVRDYAQFVAQFLSKLGLADLRAVVGHSFGGRVVIKGLADGEFTARKAVLLDSAGIKPAPSLRSHAYRLVAAAGKNITVLPGIKKLAPRLRRRLYQSAGSQDYLKSGELRQIFLNTISEDLSADAARITQPTLLIWGADDRDTPPADGQMLASAINNSKLEIISGAGHFVHADAPQRVADQILEFLQ